jgi:hypothetical protein
MYGYIPTLTSQSLMLPTLLIGSPITAGYAGVEKVYLYDSYQLPEEQFLNGPLTAQGIKSGFIYYYEDYKPPPTSKDATK